MTPKIARFDEVSRYGYFAAHAQASKAQMLTVPVLVHSKPQRCPVLQARLPTAGPSAARPGPRINTAGMAGAPARNQREIMSVHMEQYESAPLFKADNATLSFYATKDGKISVTIRAGTRARLCLRGKQFVLNWGPQRLAARIIDAHPRRFADPQDDSIFHPRTWHRAARLEVSFHRLQRGCAVGARGRMTLVSRLGQYDLVDTGRNFRVSGQPFEKR